MKWIFSIWKDAKRYRWLREHPYFPEEETLREEYLDEAIDEILSGRRMDPEQEREIRLAARKKVGDEPGYEYPHCRPMDPPTPLFRK